MFRNGCFAVVLLAFFLNRSTAADPVSRLVVVVEHADWVFDAKKVACHKTDFHVWDSGSPTWFRECSERETQIVIFTDPLHSNSEQEMWRERLKTHGCKIVLLKTDRSTGQVAKSQLYKSLHAVLTETFPDQESIWNENLQRAMRIPRILPAPKSLSFFAAFERCHDLFKRGNSP